MEFFDRFLFADFVKYIEAAVWVPTQPPEGDCAGVKLVSMEPTAHVQCLRMRAIDGYIRCIWICMKSLYVLVPVVLVTADL